MAGKEAEVPTIRAIRRAIAFTAALSLTAFGASAGPPRFHSHFPVSEPQHLGPPVVHQPIHECARAVHVSGFVPHARVEVFVNGTERVGRAEPPLGFADIPLTRALKRHEKVTATQRVEGVTSVQSYLAAEVTELAGPLGKPVVVRDIFHCGRVVPVDNLNESTRVHVFQDAPEIGAAAVTLPLTPVGTSSLGLGPVTARQVLCEDDPPRRRESLLSDPVEVKSLVNLPLPPVLDKRFYIVGNDVVAFSGLYTGARLEVTDHGVAVGGGFATGSANWLPLARPVQATSDHRGIQTLCLPSPPSERVEPTAELGPPRLLDPICAGSQFAVVRDTRVNANVVLLRNGGTAGYGGAVPGDLMITLGDNQKWNAGDTAVAFQSMGEATLSVRSNEVTVVADIQRPVVEVMGGEPFFLSENGEAAIDGPVFPRGRGAGPNVVIQACCDERVQARILAPDDRVVAELKLARLFPGYHAGRWDWTSTTGWAVPGGIPVGRYRVAVATGCDQEPVEAPFYVIFNPADVAGPPRFSFNETGIWFVPHEDFEDHMVARVYHLHPDDRRVFEKAMAAASGLTDPREAAGRVAKAEAALFKYSLLFHTNDVLHMLASFTEAQCADDASVLTALLRAIGIPAHPVTADADLENDNAEWSFDTWVEVKLPTEGGGSAWAVFHNHWPNGLPPVRGPLTRASFGATTGLAQKTYNDLIFMAGEDWVWNTVADGYADLELSRNGCGEPRESHDAVASWLIDLCERGSEPGSAPGYWNPNHWSCAGLASSTQGLTADFRPDSTETAPGEPVAGRLILAHRGARPQRGTIRVELVSDLPESKLFPDRVLASVRRRIRLAPGREAVLPVHFEAPRDLPPGHRLALRVRLGDRTVAVAAVPFTPLLEVRAEVGGEAAVGGELALTVRLANHSREPLRAVRVDVDVPPGLELAPGGEEDRREVSLAAGESATIIRRLRVTAPLEAGTLRVDVQSEAGGTRELVPVAIAGPPG